jgi:hypothetical protein
VEEGAGYRSCARVTGANESQRVFDVEKHLELALRENKRSSIILGVWLNMYLYDKLKVKTRQNVGK